MVERFPDLHISTRLLPLALAALVAASACKPKPEEEVVGTPPPEDRIAPPERAERYPLSGIEPKANQAWFKKNGWFEEEVLPMLRKRVKALVL